MEKTEIDPLWPNALRYFLSLHLDHFTPWHLMQKSSEFEFAANTFHQEDIYDREVFVFARRMDRDDFAGLEMIEGKITGKVICFHPVFANTPVEKNKNKGWNICYATFEDAFDFIAQRVIPDMKDWASEEDASDL